MALSDQTRAESVAKLRHAADLLEAGDEIGCGKLLLDGLTPVAGDLKRTYGPLVRMMVNGWITRAFNGR